MTNKVLPIKRILIANRSEIACRIIKTAKKLGIETVAVYSDIDKNLRFVEEADIAVPLNGNKAIDTYLSIQKIISIAKELKVDAIHPGYGFLSENAEFVSILDKENIGFIGPSAFSINAMGDKLKAKQLAMSVNVPTIPGYSNLIEDDNLAIKICNDIGYPVMFKAVAGGGGKGMRLVYKSEDVLSALFAVKSEAKNAYNDDRILIEKFIEEPRHIEVQIVADKHGNVVCLGDRDCSIQRFNQKVIEEAPAIFVDDDLRNRMFAASINLVKACKYHSVGTLEYVVNKNNEFFFLEMNTRLQVEHTVTEYITRLDLVELMIMIQEGKQLPFTQNDIKPLGHAIECRICAENPNRNFLPSIGRITHYLEPSKDYNVRVESSISSGDEISMFYDAMIAKLITYGDTRHEAIEVMKKSLIQYEIEGINTNIELLEAIMRNESFVNNNFSTAFIKQTFPNGFTGAPLNDVIKKSFILSSIIIFLFYKKQNISYTNNNQYLLPRNNSYHRLHIVIDGGHYIITISEYRDDFISVVYQNESMNFKYHYNAANKIIKGIIDKNYEITIKFQFDSSGKITMYSGGTKSIVNVFEPHVFDYYDFMPKNKVNKDDNLIKAPLTGRVSSVNVKVGDSVHPDSVLLTIEAMKMQNNISSNKNGIISEILTNVNDIVSNGQVLIRLK